MCNMTSKIHYNNLINPEVTVTIQDKFVLYLIDCLISGTLMAYTKDQTRKQLYPQTLGTNQNVKELDAQLESCQ